MVGHSRSLEPGYLLSAFQLEVLGRSTDCDHGIEFWMWVKKTMELGEVISLHPYKEGPASSELLNGGGDLSWWPWWIKVLCSLVHIEQLLAEVKLLSLALIHSENQLWNPWRDLACTRTVSVCSKTQRGCRRGVHITCLVGLEQLVCLEEKIWSLELQLRPLQQVCLSRGRSQVWWSSPNKQETTKGRCPAGGTGFEFVCLWGQNGGREFLVDGT